MIFQESCVTGLICVIILDVHPVLECTQTSHRMLKPHVLNHDVARRNVVSPSLVNARVVRDQLGRLQRRGELFPSSLGKLLSK